MDTKFLLIAIVIALLSAVLYSVGAPFMAGVLCMASLCMVFLAWLFGHKS